MPANKKTLSTYLNALLSADIKINPAVSHQVMARIGIAPSSSDRTIAGSIIIKSSIIATEFPSSACNQIFLARTFTSILLSAFHRLQSPQASRQIVGK